MEGLNPHWYVWMLKEQRRYNIILAFATIIIAIVGILQIIKSYNFFTPEWFLFGILILLAFCMIVILLTIFGRQD